MENLTSNDAVEPLDSGESKHEHGNVQDVLVMCGILTTELSDDENGEKEGDSCNLFADLDPLIDPEGNYAGLVELFQPGSVKIVWKMSF